MGHRLVDEVMKHQVLGDNEELDVMRNIGKTITINTTYEHPTCNDSEDNIYIYTYIYISF